MPSPTAPLPTVEQAENGLEVQLDTSAVRLPLTVAGANVAFTDVDRALDSAIRRALSPSIGKRSRKQGLTLRVELLTAHAEESSGRIVVHLSVRATLKRTEGNAFLAQTHAHASQTHGYASTHGVEAVVACANAIGTDLRDWMSGIALASQP